MTRRSALFPLPYVDCYQLVDGFRRCKALEQAGMQEIQAEIYDITVLKAGRYRREHRTAPDLPIPKEGEAYSIALYSAQGKYAV